MKRKAKNSIILFSLLALIPFTFLLSDYIGGVYGNLVYEEPENNYWNLVPNDELVWLLNDSLFYKNELQSEHNGFLRSKILSVADLLLDSDIHPDLAILNEFLLGGEEFEIPMGITYPIDNIAFLIYFYALYPFFDHESVNFALMGASGFDTYCSGAWTMVENNWDYLQKNKMTNWYWSYEIYDLNSVAQAAPFGLFSNIDEDTELESGNSVYLSPMPSGRSFSKGLNFNIDNYAEFSEPVHVWHRMNKSAIMDDSYFLDLNFPYIYLPEDNDLTIEIGIQSEESLELSEAEKYLDEDSAYFLIENNALYYMQKDKYYENTGTWTLIDNPITDHYVKICDLPTDEWFEINFKFPAECVYSTYSNHEIDETSYMDKWQFKSLDPNYEIISFSILDASGNGNFYIDDWGEVDEWNEDATTPYFEYSPAGRDNLKSAPLLMSLINPSALLIQPIPEYFDFCDFINDMWEFFLQNVDNGNIEIPEEYLTYLPDVSLTPNEFRIKFDEKLIEFTIGMIMEMEEFLTLYTLEGDLDFDCEIVFDREISCLKSLDLTFNYDNINTTRAISFELIKTKTIDYSSEGYYYYEGNYLSPNPERIYSESPYNSRLAYDDYPDVIDPSRYTLELALLMDQILGDIDQTKLFAMIIDQNKPTIIFTLGGFFGISSIFTLLVIEGKKKLF